MPLQAVSSVMALSACSNGNSVGGVKQSNTPALPQKIEVDLNDKVKVLDQAVNKDVTKVTVDDNKHLVLEVSNPQSELTNKKVGDIVYLPPKTANDLGVFVKIKEIKTNSNGSTQVITEQPDGAEVFDNVNANVTGVKPKVLGIIAPNSDLSQVNGLSQNTVLQQGLTYLGKITVPISFAINKPKPQYSSSHKQFCAYPKSFAEHKGITYDKALTELGKLCDTVFKVDGSVELNIGEIVNTMDIKKSSSGELSFKGGKQSGKISLKDTEFSINLKSKLYAKELRLSEMIGISDRYAEQYFKDYQRTSVDGYFAKVAITGLSADDKKGKIPLVGFVFGAGGAILVKGTETGIATSLASPLGGVAMVYGIIDATGKISLEIEYVYNSGKKEIGIEQKDNKISAIPQKTIASQTAKNQININGEISGETQIGGAIEGDFFLGGIRFANIGGQYVQKRNGSLKGIYKYDFLKDKHSIQGCYSWGIGEGFIFYGNLALGVEGTLDVGFFKTQGKTGIQYGFMYPEKDKQTDPNFKSDLWKYTNMVGTKKYPEICISALPSEFSIQKVQQYSIHPSHLTEVPVNIVIDRKVKNDAGVKYTTPAKYQVQIGKYDRFGFNVDSWSQPMNVWVYDDGIVTLPFESQVDEYGMPKAPFTKSNRISVPYGKSVIKVIAIDKLGRKTEKTMDVTIDKPVNSPTISSINVSPLQLTTGKPFELIITGKNLPTDRMLTVNGCNAQTQVSLAVDKHIYQCTAPAIATDNYNLSVVGTDGKTAIFNKQFKVTATTLPPITPTATKLTATGITLCGDDSRNNIVCSSLSSAWLGLLQDGQVQAGQKMDYEKRFYNKEECVIDKVTGLTWEQKTDDGGLRDKDNTYTWYNPDNRTNGGNAGKQNNGKNTHEYIKQLNASNYCGYNNWRLPTKNELRSIVDYGRYNPAIHPIFSNTQSSYYCSSSPYANGGYGAWGVSFFYGNELYDGKGYGSYVRAVRSE